MATRLSILQRLEQSSPIRLWFASVIISLGATELVVFVMELLLRGTISYPDLLIGFVTDFLVTSVIAAVLAFVLGQLKRQVQNSRQLSEELAQTEQRAQRAIAASRLALWDYDVVTGRVYLSEGWLQLLGGAPVPTVTTIDALSDLVPKEERRALRRAIVAALKGYNSSAYRVEHRVRKPNGEFLWVLSEGAVVERNRDGKALRMTGTNRDITDRKLAEETLRESEEKLRGLYELAPLGIALTDMNGHYVEFNEAFRRICGYPADELRALSYWELTPREYEAQEQVQLDSLAKTKHYGPYEKVYRQKDGTLIPIRLNGTLVTGKDGQKYIWSIVEDISARKMAEKATQDSKTILQSILDNLPYLVWLKDASGRFLAVNQPFLASTGHTRAEEVIGKTDFDLWPEHLAEKYRADDEQVIAQHHQITVEEQALNNGRLIWTETFKTPILDEKDKLLGITGFARDITEKKMEELKVRHQAHHDALTELPNRILFSDRLQQALARARRNKEQLAVLFLDLDQFKPVNDTFGHDVGDLLLKEVGRRLRTCVRESDTVARIGGDEFCALLTAIESGRDASIVATKILDALRQPYHLRKHRVIISSSIGIALYPKDGRDEPTLMKNADIAMYWAKAAGRDNLQFFRVEMQRPSLPDTEPRN
jgi:diguanylate cyclase (GGDEF)-like protein/PAS domain S-box-containing protein